MTTKQLALSTFASLTAMAGGALVAAAAIHGLSDRGLARSVPVLEGAIILGVFVSGIALGVTARALRVNLWPGLLLLAILLAAATTLAFPKNPWQVAHAIAVFGLPLALGVPVQSLFRRSKLDGEPLAARNGP